MPMYRSTTLQKILVQNQPNYFDLLSHYCWKKSIQHIPYLKCFLFHGDIFSPWQNPFKKGHGSEKSKHLKTGMSIPIFPMSSDLERGVVHNSQHQPGIHKKNQRIPQQNKEHPQKIRLISRGKFERPTTIFPMNPYDITQQLRQSPTVFSCLERPRRSTQPPLPFSEVASEIGCWSVMIMVAPGCTGCHKPQEEVWF